MWPAMPIPRATSPAIRRGCSPTRTPIGDYVIDAFNNDLPFDRFLIEQLAADRLELGEDKRPLAAMGFLTLGRRFLNNPHDIIDDRIDVVTRGMMGLTVSCARCHDHKYDPVPTADYYSLYGVFASSHEPKDKPFISDSIDPVQRASFEKERKRREDSLKNYEKGTVRAHPQTGETADRRLHLGGASSGRCRGRQDRRTRTQIQARPGCDPALDEPLGQAPRVGRPGVRRLVRPGQAG